MGKIEDTYRKIIEDKNKYEMEFFKLYRIFIKLNQ